MVTSSSILHNTEAICTLLTITYKNSSPCAKKYKVRKLYAFGSILTPRFNEQSDIDILVDFNAEINHNNYADNYFDFYYALKSLFGREIDLVDESSVKNPYFKEELEETKYLIYG